MLNCRNVFILILSGLCCSSYLHTRPIGGTEAQKAVRGWLKTDTKPFGTVIGMHVGDVDIYAGNKQEPMRCKY